MKKLILALAVCALAAHGQNCKLVPDPLTGQLRCGSSGGSPGGAASGALTGNYPSPTLRDFVSVKDFGAKGDGATDDTAAIQAAINFCSTTACRVLFPAASYKITSSLFCNYPGCTLGGDSTGAIINFQPAASNYQGTVTTNGTSTVTWASGPAWDPKNPFAMITINNIVYQVTSVLDATHLTVWLASGEGIGAGTFASAIPSYAIQAVIPSTTASITGITNTSPPVATVSSTTGCVAGGYATIGGVTPSGYNQTAYVIASVNTGASTVTLSGSGQGAYVSGGTIYCSQESAAISIKNFSFTGSLNVQKVAVKLTDVSSSIVSNLRSLNGSTAWFSNGAAAPSYGVETHGRDSTVLRDIRFNSDAFIYIGQNANVPTISLDHFTFEDMYCVAGAWDTCWYVQDGTALTQDSWIGRQAWVRPNTGFFFSHLNDPVVHNGLLFMEQRPEQAAAATTGTLNTDAAGTTVTLVSGTLDPWNPVPGLTIAGTYYTVAAVTSTTTARLTTAVSGANPQTGLSYSTAGWQFYISSNRAVQGVTVIGGQGGTASTINGFFGHNTDMLSLTGYFYAATAQCLNLDATNTRVNLLAWCQTGGTVTLGSGLDWSGQYNIGTAKVTNRSYSTSAGSVFQNAPTTGGVNQYPSGAVSTIAQYTYQKIGTGNMIGELVAAESATGVTCHWFLKGAFHTVTAGTNSDAGFCSITPHGNTFNAFWDANVTIASCTNANPVVCTITANTPNNYPKTGQTITISGFTGNWTPLNGAQAVTADNGSSTFTVAIDSTGFGAVTGTPIVQGKAAFVVEQGRSGNASFYLTFTGRAE